MLPAILIAALVVIGIACAVAFTRYDDRRSGRPRPKRRPNWSTPDTAAGAAAVFAADVADGGDGGGDGGGD
jgi:hypothetical protein